MITFEKAWANAKKSQENWNKKVNQQNSKEPKNKRYKSKVYARGYFAFLGDCYYIDNGEMVIAMGLNNG